MEISYVNTYWDVAQFTLDRSLHSWPIRLACLASVVIGSYIYWNADYTHGHPFIVLFIAYLVILPISVATFVMILIVGILLEIPFGKNASYRRECTTTLTEEGLKTESAIGYAFYAWAGIPRVLQTSTCIAIYVSERAAYLIPIRAFRSASRAKEFYDYALSHCQAKRGVRSA